MFGLLGCIKPRYAVCTSDHSLYYQMTGVVSVEQISVNPVIYELEYKDGSFEQIYMKNCYIPKNSFEVY